MKKFEYTFSVSNFADNYLRKQKKSFMKKLAPLILCSLAVFVFSFLKLEEFLKSIG